MKCAPRWIVATPALVLVHASLSAAQANADPRIDVRLSNMRELAVFGRQGAFPNAINGIAIETTVCNEGTSEVPWMQPMSPDHPTIAFLIANVREGRILQISNRSYIKHGFFALNGSGCQTPCTPPTSGNIGEALGLGCSDTYSTINNGDSFYLGPPDELDPWLGTWTRRCSLFDRGFPDVGAPENCDGRRSLTHQAAAAQGPIATRVQVRDSELLAGGTLFFQAQYIVEGMPDAARNDSLGSRAFSASWTGSRWNLTPTTGLLAGSVLQRWPGATLASSTDGDRDGRVFVAAKVTGPIEGFYRYEYALHNRDHARGVGSVRIPLCLGARVRGVGFRDIDRDVANDWVSRVKKSEVEFTSSGRPLAWNTIYNFWFESDAAPGRSDLALLPFDARPDEIGFFVDSHAPTALYNVHLGPGCATGTPPTLYATGSPARAELGNATFALVSRGNQPFQPNFLLHGSKSGSRNYLGCTFWTGAGGADLVSMVTTDANGVATHPGPIPNDIVLEGRLFRFQAVGRDPAHGRLFSDFELSEGLLVRVGNAIPACQ
jgi:hypothetical protein